MDEETIKQLATDVNNVVRAAVESLKTENRKLWGEINSVTEDYEELMKERADYIAENNRFRVALEKIKSHDTHTIYREGNASVMAKMAEQALKDNVSKSVKSS